METDMELSRRESLGGLQALTVAGCAAGAATPAAGPWAHVSATQRKVVGERLTAGLQVCVREHGKVGF